MAKEKFLLSDELFGGRTDYSDVLDALKDATKVYDENDYSLSSNFVWSKQPDQKTQDYIIRMHAVAKKIESSFIDWRVIDVGTNGKAGFDEFEGGYKYKEIINPFKKKAYSLIMLPANDWSILNRNNDENTILKGILQWNSTEKELSSGKESGEGLVEKVLPKQLTKYLKKKKQKEEVVIGGE